MLECYPLNANLTNNNSQLNTKQTQGDGTVNQMVQKYETTYGVGLDWTIFDGFNMFAQKNN